MGKNKKKLDIFFLEESKIWRFCMGYRLNPRKSVNHVIFIGFWWFSMKSFAQVMGLLFESVRAHTYSRYGQDRTPRRIIDFQHIVKEEHITHLGLLMLSVTYLQNHIKQCYASINSKHEHPPRATPGVLHLFSARVLRICTIWIARGSDLLSKYQVVSWCRMKALFS